MNYPEELTNTYDIYEEIGSGGGGTVYRAVHKRLQKVVVLKKLKGSATSIMDCRTEVDILKNLRHSYLPQVLDFIESSEGIFTVMDYIPGKSLQKMLDEGHKFKEKEVLKYTRQICEALDYLHSQNPPIVHGDIKPDNIMITPEGNVCLIDFNISGILEGRGAITFGYTPGFGAPEQIEAFEKLKKEMQKADKTALFSDAGETDKTVLLSDAGETDKTMLLSDAGETDKTVLLSDAGEKAVADGALPVSQKSKASEPVKGIRIDKRSDIYALGATIYTLLTGELRNPKDKKLVLTEVSSGLVVVLNKALAYSPSKRYADAGKMLQAVLAVHKKDKRYKKLLRRQEATFIFLFLMISISVICVVKGMKTMGEERKERYAELISNMQDATKNGALETEFDMFYSEAIKLNSNNQEAFYEKAYYMYTFKGAEAAAEYISEIIYYFAYGNSTLRSNMYYLYAECNFKMEQYDKAAQYYKEAVNSWQGSAQIYRDYAISLIYLDRLSEAEKVLDLAVEAGMEQADIFMVQGELARMNGNFSMALECLEGVLKETTDSYMRERAYVIASEIFEEIGTKEALLEDIEWLAKAEKELEANNRLLIYEHLVKDYSALGEMTGDNAYYGKATTVLEKIITMGWSNYLTYSNIVVLYQRMGDMENAGKWAEEMLQKYPENYVTYLRLCYLEIEEQNQKENKERSYKEFVKYYEKAKECYEKQVSGNVTNSEMQLLEQTYKQILDGGWLE